MTATLVRPPELDRHHGVSYFEFADANSKVSVLKHSNGTARVGGLKVFRTGTFRDSVGEQHTWEPIHLQQMVNHFNLLRDAGLFTHVPVRADHGSIFTGRSIDKVVGWVADLHVKKDGDNHFLVGDFDFTEPEGFAKWERGTYMGRSLEVGMYETNDEALYWPVMMGVAFVDIPACEGLYQKADGASKAFVMFGKESPVGEQNEPQPQNQPNGTPEPGQPAPAAPAPAAQSTPAAPAAPAPAAPAAPAPAAPPAAPASAQSAHAFQVAGQSTTDFSAVQRHIDALEGTIETSRKESVREYVKGLAKANKVAAPVIDSLTEHALTLSSEQFEGFKKSYDAAPAASLFAEHGAGGEGGSGESPEKQALADAEAQIHWLRKSGWNDEKIEKSEAYAKVRTLKEQLKA